MARRTRNPVEKTTWLKMAQDWLRMSKGADKENASDRFDLEEKARGTGQTRSEAEH
jgi:hypothetical protein